MRKTAILLTWAIPVFSLAAVAQTTSQTITQTASSPAPQTALEPAAQAAAAAPATSDPASAATNNTAPAAAAAQPAAAQPAVASAPAPAAASGANTTEKTVEVPAGTKVLLALRSGVNTKTAQPGDSVYLSSQFPVIAGSRAVIPAGVYVQGVIDNVVRPGRVKGRAQITMHFTTLIFPNGSVVSIPGAVDSLPGSDGPAVKKKDGEGTIEQAGSKGHDAATIAKTTAAGAGIGGLAGIDSDNAGKAIGYGAAAGAVGGLIYTLFTRGNEVVLPEGQTIEMVFQRPLELKESDVATADGTMTTAFVPTGKQPQPLPKPGRTQKVLCPVGTLGCQ